MDTESLYQPYAEEGYRLFSERLTKIHDLPYKGVRIPRLRTLARALDDFPYEIRYHEDVLLRGFWIASRRISFSNMIPLIQSQLPFLSTWDEADSFAAAIKVKVPDAEAAYSFFLSLLDAERPMVCRLGIVALMSNHRLFHAHRDSMLEAIAGADSDDYYISMAVAWAFSFFIIDDPSARSFLPHLSEATRKRTEQKLRDSHRTKR